MEEIKIKLKDHKYANCYVVKNEMGIKLVSYKTEVIIAAKAEIEDYWYIKCLGTFSKTTAKHIGWFLKEYFPMFNYYDMKNNVGKNPRCCYRKF